jgi:N-acetylmuramoyl-L-alanine amidase
LRTQTAVERAEIEMSRQATVRQGLERDRDRWKMDVIVIDAGHGGVDPGTIGVRGTPEKDITLAIALKLGALIEKQLPDVKVVYTRTDDSFVELYRRAQIANEVGGKLFISIHCNSTERKPSSLNGFEIYLLRPGKTESAIEIAERENAVITLEQGYEQRYQELTEENFILVTMQQMAFMKYSETFAEIAARAMSKSLNIKNSGVKQAGFYVLVGASMPNVLVEVGYLSNRNEETILRGTSGQKKIAEALFEGIVEYKNEYEKGIQSPEPSREGR